MGHIVAAIIKTNVLSVEILVSYRYNMITYQMDNIC